MCLVMTDIFVLLVYWVYQAELQCKVVQMEQWDGTVLDINATCTNVEPKRLRLLGMHALSRCDKTSYLYGKGKISALNTLLPGDFPGLTGVSNEVGTTHADLMQANGPGSSIECARFRLFTKRRKAPKSWHTSNIQLFVASHSESISTSHVVEGSRPTCPTQ